MGLCLINQHDESISIGYMGFGMFASFLREFGWTGLKAKELSPHVGKNGEQSVAIDLVPADHCREICAVLERASNKMSREGKDSLIFPIPGSEIPGSERFLGWEKTFTMNRDEIAHWLRFFQNGPVRIFL